MAKDKKIKVGRSATPEQTALAILNNAAANDRAAFVVMGGNLQTPDVYRSSLERVWKQSMSGIVSKSIRAEAYGISAAAYAATNYRAQVLSDTPVNVFFKGGGESDWNPIPYFLSTLPTLAWHIEATLIIYGVCYLRKVYNDYSYPAGLEWIHPDDVTPQTDIKGRVEEYYIDAVRYMPTQMVEIRTFDPQRTLDGKSEFEVALSRMTTEQSIVRHAGSFFFNSARPDGLLLSKNKLGKVDQIKAEAEWKKFKGSENAWKTFVSSGQWEWVPLTGAPVDLAMVDLSTKNDRDILAIMRTNPALLGFADVSDPLSAGATLREIKRNHIEDVTIPRLGWILRHLNEQWLFPDFGHGDLYQLGVDKSKMPILSDIDLGRAQTASSLGGGATGTVIADYGELRNTMGLGDREIPYLARNPAEISAVWRDTGLTLDEWRSMMGLEKFGVFGGDLVRLPSGVLVHLPDLPKAAAAMLQTLIQGSLPPPPPAPFQPPQAPQFILPPGGFGGGGGHNLPPPQSNPALPPGAAAKSDLTKLARLVLHSRRSGGATNEAAILLTFAGNKQIEAIQTLLTASASPDQPPPEWTEADDFHITLIMAESLTPAAEQSCYELLGSMPPIELTTGEIGTFPAGEDGKTPVVLFIADSPGLETLREYQQKLFDCVMAAEPGAMLSEFSAPDGWTPHITLCYAVGEFTPPAVKFPLQITPTALELSRKIYEVTYQAPVKPPNGSESPPVSLAAEPTNRAASSIRLALAWPENNFILMAQRVAASALQSAGVSGIEWYPPKNWSLDLGSVTGTAGQANQILNNFQPGENPRLDLTAYAFQLSGSKIYLMCDPAESLSKLSASVNLQLEDAGIRTDEGAFIPGIALGELTASDPNQLMDCFNALNDSADKLGMQLVAGNVDLIVNNQPRTSWELRSYNAAQKDELNQWKRKASNKKSDADKSFKTSALSGSLVESYVRAALAEIDPDDLPEVNTVFNRAKRILTDGVNYLDLPDSPDEFDSYWSHFDSLTHNLGAAWSGYMKKATPAILKMLETDNTPTSVLAPLEKYHDDLAAEWLGTPDEPGELVKLILAGMAAGNESLKGAVNMNPAGRAIPSGFKTSYTPPPQFTGIGVQVDWNLLNQQAYDFARQYSYKLIKGLDATTQAKVQDTFAAWVKSGAAQPALKAALLPIFNDPTRADSIAETESIRAYNEGAFKRWKDVGVTKAVWRTVQDPKVCPICRPLNGQVADIEAGWIHPGGNYIDPYDNQRVSGDAFRGKVYRASAHTRCRCYRRPVVIYEKPNVPQTDPQTETVSKTRFAGVKIDEVLTQLDSEYADIRSKLAKRAALDSGKIAEIKVQQIPIRAGLEDIHNQIKENFNAMDGIEKSDPRWESEYAKNKELRQQRYKLEDALKANIDEITAQQKRGRDAILKTISTPTDFEIKNFPNQAAISAPDKIMLKEAKKAEDFITKIMDGDSFQGLEYKINNAGAGARANAGGGSVNMAPDDAAWVYVHEIGHIIDHKFPDVLDRTREFLQYRIEGQPIKKLSEWIPGAGYSDYEIAAKDNFDNAYIGKIYKNPDGSIRSSEILSMGIQYMFQDAAGFAARDPEYFNFILGIMRRQT